MSMNRFNPGNSWEEAKRESKDGVWRILSNLLLVLMIAFALFAVTHCATAKQQPCDVLFDKTTGEAIHIYNCD